MTQKREKPIEQRFRKAAQALGCIAVKFEDPAHIGAPDRLILTPRGRAVFLEFKRPGETPGAHQVRYMDRLHAMGFLVGWADNYDSAIRWIEKVITQ
jgi:hypothetical protein